jgi:hypothetical protein
MLQKLHYAYQAYMQLIPLISTRQPTDIIKGVAMYLRDMN